MRDAFGGAFMIRLFLVFVCIYMFFTAIALNYAKAFKVKNKVIDYLEDNEIYNVGQLNVEEADAMSEYLEKELLGKLNYHAETSVMDCQDVSKDACSEPNGIGVVYCQNGIKITQYCPSSVNRNKLGTYYRVDTYFTWSLPFLKQLMALSNSGPNGDVASGIWKISGETRTIVKQ